MASNIILRGHALRMAVGITAMFLVMAGGAGAATFTVCPSGCPYSSIQAAINASTSGDTILVNSGTYYETVNINKQLILRGIDSSGGKPVVNGKGNGYAIVLSAGLSTLEGFIAVNASYLGIHVISSNNIIRNNSALNSYIGIALETSTNNILIGNTVANNSYSGIDVYSSSNGNMLSSNLALNNNNGIDLSYSSNNILNGNNASNNFYSGIRMGSFTSNNTLKNNTMMGNKYNFGLSGYSSTDRFDNQIDTSNMVNGKPIYYIRGHANEVYDSSTNAGTFYCINCVNVTIKDLNLNSNIAGIFFWNTTNSRIQNISTSNNRDGIELASSSNNILSGNYASNNDNGIYLDFNNNTLSSNNASNNTYGIYLWASSNQNLNGNNVSNNIYGIYLFGSNNNIINNNYFSNTNNAISVGNSIWNTTKTYGTNIIGGLYLGGNFWGNPSGTGFSQTCTDANSDGICDSPYTLDTDNIDYLPLAYKAKTEIRGDVNRNGVLDTGDATLILRYIVDLSIPSEYLPILPTGDMNCNGILDTGDATLVLRDIVGLDIPRCWE